MDSLPGLDKTEKEQVARLEELEAENAVAGLELDKAVSIAGKSVS